MDCNSSVEPDVISASLDLTYDAEHDVRIDNIPDPF